MHHITISTFTRSISQSSFNNCYFKQDLYTYNLFMNIAYISFVIVHMDEVENASYKQIDFLISKILFRNFVHEMMMP